MIVWQMPLLQHVPHHRATQVSHLLCRAPRLLEWSWGNQGVFLDVDGTLATSAVLGTHNAPAAGTGWALGNAGITLHSGIDTDLFRPSECAYLARRAGGAADPTFGVACSPALRFKRVMLNGHAPNTLLTWPLQVTDLASPRSSSDGGSGSPAVAQALRTANVTFSHYNEEGYQFMVASGPQRSYWVHWALPQRVDPDRFTLHTMDLMEEGDYVMIAAKEAQVRCCAAVRHAHGTAELLSVSRYCSSGLQTGCATELLRAVQPC
jgi:hypothetical protein